MYTSCSTLRVLLNMATQRITRDFAIGLECALSLAVAIRIRPAGFSIYANTTTYGELMAKVRIASYEDSSKPVDIYGDSRRALARDRSQLYSSESVETQ
jgi:hypothetical protein